MSASLSLRPATMEDATLLFTWRNDPQTREASHSQGEICFDNHLDWLKNSLCDPNRKVYIAEDKHTPVGTVRADWQQDAFDLSWTVAPESRGRGIGKRMVSLLVQELNNRVRAQVKVGNMASAQIARSAGMSLNNTKDGIMYFSKPPEKRILIIVPAFNEEGNLPFLLDELKAYQHQYDVLVVDDASNDGSAFIARQFEGVAIIQLAANLGIGGAVQTGFKYAVTHNYDVVVQVDGDGQHDPVWLEKVTAPILNGEVNCVIGSRYTKENPDRDYKTPFFRRMGMLFSSYILFLASSKRIADTTSGLRVLDRQALNFFAKDYPVDHPEAEALLMLMRQGFTIKEIPVKMRSRQTGQSLFTSLKAVKYPFRVLVGFLGLLIKKKR